MNPWVKVKDELPPEGLIVEVRSGSVTAFLSVRSVFSATGELVKLWWIPEFLFHPIDETPWEEWRRVG